MSSISLPRELDVSCGCDSLMQRYHLNITLNIDGSPGAMTMVLSLCRCRPRLSLRWDCACPVCHLAHWHTLSIQKGDEQGYACKPSSKNLQFLQATLVQSSCIHYTCYFVANNNQVMTFEIPDEKVCPLGCKNSLQGASNSMQPYGVSTHNLSDSPCRKLATGRHPAALADQPNSPRQSPLPTLSSR